jgi:hypothetical protein
VISQLTPEQFRQIQAELGWTHAQTASALGISEISVKRLATGGQYIEDRVRKALVAVLLLHRDGAWSAYEGLLKSYRDDTIQTHSLAEGSSMVEGFSLGARVREVGKAQVMSVKGAAGLVATAVGGAVTMKGRVICEWRNSRGRLISRSFVASSLELVAE